MAINRCVDPMPKLAGETGVTAMEVITGATTVKLTGGLIMSDIEAVILTVPLATPVTVPVEDIVATAVLELFQVA